MGDWITEGPTERFEISSSTAQTRYVPAPQEHVDTIGDAVAARSPRYTSQAYFWSQDWQQAERLADWAGVTGDDFRPTDLRDLIRWLEDGRD